MTSDIQHQSTLPVLELGQGTTQGGLPVGVANSHMWPTKPERISTAVEGQAWLIQETVRRRNDELYLTLFAGRSCSSST